ncbi:hypothetical protein [Legionella israelensis]|uniref:Uncharacterized protein n=1 Tax=Legionella israelensis TaxID=454 RepID=A0A0W0V2U4_9GAMM|nr:hypothetical protein [Legionella israelensis]KTD14410.1 hypothetical protein Lisr_2638 [Legionella israelensis]QBS10168.1 hypothetical protein E4T55_10060 [Legionella israelensis]SCY35061.1 hypothetical protein SAMN02746069_02136 [Legionella israelensis DSM 19235]STX59759.1 Uncharacterised protein [Legionella israelensis]
MLRKFFSHNGKSSEKFLKQLETVREQLQRIDEEIKENRQESNSGDSADRAASYMMFHSLSQRKRMRENSEAQLIKALQSFERESQENEAHQNVI